ncbi:YIEGIA family protein [Schinkia azotoformans]|uniref:Spore envelope assembly protein n=1 Tax=Schinkia azotoformans LMG 9581 TaxID=1131731 RepID=K6CG94_SCHAZ|nr:YIEGIA family protein [Schinkia azotoformans]EKN70155.1 spore envelope assembly protein [Schinkia azotoformans LMG 9581]MEC1636990.1 YIEGIA family protein [Schinkia azotoformans]MEC1718626.1 YIEGIA family protein [Schinkia azotoformans]MEC1722190.1 YIEGIA family protein [Schinkia azotoformans]MEC1743000.1 YIEGIA family protein [Schinkia azotoformans]
MEKYVLPVIVGTLVGFVARIILLRTDFRQYPTYPTGRIIHLSFGFIAAFIGAVAVPSVLESNWAAVTFLGLAATQFREVRKMERETLEIIDNKELVKRGEAFIEGMAQAFEGRNYVVMFSALISTLVAVYNIWLGMVVGLVLVIIVKPRIKGKVLIQMAEISEGEIRFEGPNLFVSDIHIKNVGLVKSRKIIKEKAVGAIITPKNENGIVTLSHLGQRQAMLHHISNVLGSYLDSGEPDLIPLSKRDMEDGRIALFFLPREKDFKQIKEVLKHVPILDSAIRLPRQSDKGKQ